MNKFKKLLASFFHEANSKKRFRNSILPEVYAHTFNNSYFNYFNFLGKKARKQNKIEK